MNGSQACDLIYVRTDETLIPATDDEWWDVRVLCRSADLAKTKHGAQFWLVGPEDGMAGPIGCAYTPDGTLVCSVDRIMEEWDEGSSQDVFTVLGIFRAELVPVEMAA